MLPQKLKALLTSLYGVDNDVVQITAPTGDCPVIFLCNRTKVAKPAQKSAQFTFSLRFPKFRRNPTSSVLVLPRPDHVVESLLLLTNLLLYQSDCIFEVSFLFVVKVLRFLNQPIRLIMLRELLFGYLKLHVVAIDKTLALLDLALNLVPTSLNRRNLRLLAVYLRFGLSHLSRQLVKGTLDLLLFLSQLFGLLAHFDVDLLEGRFLCALLFDAFLVVGLQLRKLLLNLCIAVDHLLLLSLVFSDLLLCLGYLHKLVFLLAVDHNILALQQLKVSVEVLLPSFSFILLGVQVL